MADPTVWVPAVIGAATLGFVVIDRIRRGGNKDATTADGIKQLSEQIGRIETSTEKTAVSVAENTAMAIRLTSRADEHERRIGLVEGVRDSFVSHAATDVAEHAAMRESIDHLRRASENVSAQIARLTPADTFTELSGRRRKTGTDE